MRRSEALKIQAHCPAGADIDHDTDKGASFCHTCSQTVHDLSGMRESEVDAFLKGLRGKSACVSYRVDAHGEPLLLADPPSRLHRCSNALAGIGLAGTLSACAPWGVETGPASRLPTQAAVCVYQPDGSQVCTGNPWEFEEVEAKQETGAPPKDEAEDELQVGETGCSRPGPSAPAEVEGTTRVDGNGATTVRLDFSIDPNDRMRMGMIVYSEYGETHDAKGRLKYVPTAQLIREWRARRAVRVAERRAQKAAKRARKKPR